jgi:beta-N-acetylhexosaminidase
MIGHARYLDLDPSGTASSLSAPIIRGILHKEWNYQGCVISDDMDMGAILNEYGFDDAFKMALEAGNDLILLCHRTEKAVDARRILETVAEPLKQEAWKRIDQFRAKLAKPYDFSIEQWQKLDSQVQDLRVSTLGAEHAQTRSADDGKRSPVEVY